ncbi:DEAD/DEAH box helicase [Metabacillus indicus]|uniref:Helicase ATP-binding domain-containing protein n=1 Tax=Metabacillus indicus TaxID=246786 RepID=A0A084GIL2_METID|nr:hypothetical protein [Metabacillus indicus]KEZ47174.1 hypothetical protein GS18_0220195 [Metabacillus indicus]
MNYLAERFNQQDFLNMEPGYNYGFWSEPDSGKTTMIVKHLIPLAERENKSILFLYPRAAIGEQLEYKFVSHVIDYRTYQSLEDDLNNGLIINHYDYIVCDEAHYFVEDADFNENTELSFEFINNERNSVKILLTGTPEPLQYAEFKKPVIPMSSVNYSNHNVEVVFLTRSTKMIENQIRKVLKDGQQTLVFSSSATQAYEISRNFLEHNPFFISSKGNQSFKDKNDEDIRTKIIKEEKTERPIGFMTAAMNTGINFNEDVKNVVILGSPSSVDIRQSVARVRKGSSGRKVRLYVQVPYGQAIRTKVESIKRDLEFIDIGIYEWQKQFGKRKVPSFVWHETDKNNKDLAHIKINKLKLAKLKSDMADFSTMSCDTVGTYKRMVEKYYPSTAIHWMKSSSENVEEFLEENEGKFLVKIEQDAVKAIFKKSGITSKSGTVGPNIIRDYLYQKNNYSLELPLKSINGKKQQVWQFNKI